MSYSAKEIYLTIQGEGFWTGRTAVFCRFSGCNLWSGLDKDRANAISFVIPILLGRILWVAANIKPLWNWWRK